MKMFLFVEVIHLTYCMYFTIYDVQLVHSTLTYFQSYNDKLYITAQAPLPDYIPEFWQMIWEQDCPRIVMLANLIDNGHVSDLSLSISSMLKQVMAGESDWIRLYFR